MASVCRSFCSSYFRRPPSYRWGQYVGERLDRFRRDSSSLWGYSLDLLGSLLGVIAFTVVSFIGAWPATWFAGIGLFGLVVIASKKRLWAYYGVAMIAIVVAVQATEPATDYSPYYALATVPTSVEPGFAVIANGSLHQRALNMVQPPSGHDGAYAMTRVGYHLPVREMKGPKDRALVLGAGTGNDVAMLLDEAFSEVHAVEIDPVILQMGLDHPNRPYESGQGQGVQSGWARLLEGHGVRVRFDRIRDSGLDDPFVRSLERAPRQLRLHEGGGRSRRLTPDPRRRAPPVFHDRGGLYPRSSHWPPC